MYLASCVFHDQKHKENEYVLLLLLRYVYLRQNHDILFYSEKRKRECSIPSSPSVIDESPQKLSALIDESSQNLSPVFTNSPAKSDVLSPVSSRPNQLSNHLTNSDGPAVKRFNLASLSSIKVGPKLSLFIFRILSNFRQRAEA